MFPFDERKSERKEASSLAQRFLSFCVAVLAGVVLLYLAVQLLAQFWGWLVVLAIVVGAVVAGVWGVRWWRSRW